MVMNESVGVCGWVCSDTDRARCVGTRWVQTVFLVADGGCPFRVSVSSTHNMFYMVMNESTYGLNESTYGHIFIWGGDGGWRYRVEPWGKIKHKWS